MPIIEMENTHLKNWIGGNMWWNIIKDTKQSSRQLINLDWDEEAISIEDEDCLKWLVEYDNILTKYDDLVSYRMVPPSIDKIPNQLACLIKNTHQQNIAGDPVDLKDYGFDTAISFDLNPSIEFGTGWFEIGILIANDKIPFVAMNSVLTRTWARCPPETEIERIKGNTKQIVGFTKRFVGGRNTWMNRMCGFLKELINHANNPNLEDYCIDSLTKQWYYWLTKLGNEYNPDMRQKDLEQIKEIIETKYWN